MTENAQQDEQPFRNPNAPDPDKPTGGDPLLAVVGGILPPSLVLSIVIPNPHDQPTEGNKLGPHENADIYRFWQREWATPNTLRVVALGPHSPQDAKKKAGPTFAESISPLRGRSVISKHMTQRRGRGSIGYADEDGS